MELAEYYNLDECVNRTVVLGALKKLKKDGKIEYELNGEILRIDDIDLDESEIEDLLDLFDKNDVFEDSEYGDWDDEDSDLDNDWDDEY